MEVASNGRLLPPLAVMYPRERNVPGWIEAYRRGQVPDLWPYGLDQMGLRSASTRFVELAPPSLASKFLAKTVTARVRARLDEDREEIAVTWDENAAHRMWTTSPHYEMYSGAIWLTDQLQALRDGRFSTMRRALRSMSGVWVISSGQVEALERFLGPGRPPVGYFRFGVDADFFTAQPAPEKPLVLSIGGDRDRDTATLYAALEMVHALAPEVRLVVQSKSNSPAPAGVRVLKHVSHRELRDLYVAASVVAIATRHNLHASGMTVSLEAMATGRPVAITETPGIEAYVAHGSTGLLSSVGEPRKLAQNVLELLSDRDLAEGMGRAGREAVVEGLTTRHMTHRLSRFIAEARTPGCPSAINIA